MINIRKVLIDTWKRDITSNMKKTNIGLGKGVGKRTDIIRDEKEFIANLPDVWNTIEDFGINVMDLKELNPSQQELYEIYNAIKAYRISIRYLRILKGKMEGGRNIG